MDCGTVLGRVYRFGPQAIARIREEQGEDIQVIDHLAVPPGWAPRRDGSWRLSNYARKRIEKGQRPKLRQAPENMGMRPNAVLYSAFDPLPAKAVCPNCGRENIILTNVVSVGLVCLIA